MMALHLLEPLLQRGSTAALPVAAVLLAWLVFIDIAAVPGLPRSHCTPTPSSTDDA